MAYPFFGILASVHYAEEILCYENRKRIYLLSQYLTDYRFCDSTETYQHYRAKSGNARLHERR
jgi:hypothetical protein